MPLLPDSVTLGPVTLAVADLGRASDFYTRVLGFETLARTETSLTLGAGGDHLVTLVEKPEAKRQPRFSTGLYHVAILLPTQADLARLIIHITQVKYPLSGYADHLVSEAFYLNDPDGNGIELYRDRPRTEWPMMDGGMVQMDNAPIDFNVFFAGAEREGKPWTGMPAGTVIGHMHIKVGNADRARDFYRDVIGFDVMAYFPGAAFVSAGGYHHHLGMNAWESRGASAPGEESVGLQEWTIVTPDTATLEAIAGRAKTAEALLEQSATHALVSDPWGTKVRIAVS